MATIVALPRVQGTTAPLGNVARNFNSRRRPVTGSDRVPGPYPYYGAAGIQDHVADFLFDGLYVLVGEDGTVETEAGTPLVQLVSGKFWVNNHAHVWQCDSESDTRFLAYSLSTVSIRPVITGAVQPKVNLTNLKQLEIPWPEKERRSEVASILGALDDKIELNRRMNRTLEELARAVFKAWFVDFLPVKAKMDGAKSFPGMDADTFALFPDSFQDSPLGPIPKGWRVECLGQIADVNWGDTTATKAAYSHEGYPAFSASGQDGLLAYFDHDRTGVVVSAIGANAGLTWLAYGRWSCIKNTIRFWSVHEDVPTEFLYLATCGKQRWPMRGSAQPFISQSDARAIDIVIPANELGIRFTTIARPWLNLINVNNLESTNLEMIRDLMLPRLLLEELL